MSKNIIIGIVIFVVLAVVIYFLSSKKDDPTKKDNCDFEGFKAYIQDRNLDLHNQYRNNSSHPRYNWSSAQIWAEAEKQVRSEWKCPSK